jgi:hypothetical protein
MARHIFIVGRSHRPLYDVLIKRFENDQNVTVVLDRRVSARRVRTVAPAPEQERRHLADRRSRPSIDDELKWRSHAIVTLPN